MVECATVFRARRPDVEDLLETLAALGHGEVLRSTQWLSRGIDTGLHPGCETADWRIGYPVLSSVSFPGFRGAMPPSSIKDEAQRVLDELPENATWDDLMRRIYVRQSIESGIEDSDAGRTIPVDELREKLGLEP